MRPFSIKNRSIFMRFGHAVTRQQRFVGPFFKRVSKHIFLKMIPLTSLGKLHKCKFVKTVTTCACILHVQSLGM